MELIHVSHDQLEPHPHNPRFDVGDVSDIAPSIGRVGILEPLVVAPGSEPGRYRVVAGHRRAAAHRQAFVNWKSSSMPAVLREDLDTDEKQLKAMLIENLHRRDLSPAEQAAAFAQLKLDFGLKPKDIARDIGLSKSVVDRRLALMKLPEQTRQHIHSGQITLSQAEALVEFAKDADVLADLTRAAGTSNFDWRLACARRDRDRAAAHAKALKDAKAAGIAIVDEADLLSDWRWSRDPDATHRNLNSLGIDPDDHARDCQHHVLVDTGLTLLPACAQPDRHPRPDPAPATTGDSVDPAEQARREQLRDDLAAAEQVRRQWLDELLDRRLDADLRHAMLGAALACLLVDRAEAGALDELASQLDLTPPPEDSEDTWDAGVVDLTRQVAAWPADRITKGLLVALLPDCVPHNDYGWDRLDVRVLYAQLAALGYQPSTIERRMLGQTEAAADA